MQTIEDTFLKTTEVKEKHYLLIIEVNEFENLIRNSNLTIHIREVFSLTQSKHLTIAVFGTDKVKGEQHFAITKPQILTKCYFRFVKKERGRSDFSS
ncbi:hypothetical protein NQ318_010908 [Aromia moschata]|uniref:Uncharacterized protein n=1 Tax=Aromia moschata TaxID=1265417 RepID=A0AAV8XDS0_9CUCU|nr:hypothetical protein NQ318_010908 [Aromia moschata]